MGCDYYIQSELVIVYIDSNNKTCKTITNRSFKKIYLTNISGFDSDNDEKSQQIKYNQELQTAIDKNNYKKTIYENNEWVKKSYKKRYLRDLRCLCPGIIKIINIYKNYLAWKRKLNLLEP